MVPLSTNFVVFLGLHKDIRFWRNLALHHRLDRRIDNETFGIFSLTNSGRTIRFVGHHLYLNIKGFYVFRDLWTLRVHRRVSRVVVQRLIRRNSYRFSYARIAPILSCKCCTRSSATIFPSSAIYSFGGYSTTYFEATLKIIPTTMRTSQG